MLKGPKINRKILLSTLLLAVLVVTAFVFLSPHAVTTTIGIQFDGIGKGLNPDGTRFDFNTIRDEVVVKRVCELAGVPYTPDIRDSIEIKPLLPAGIVELIKEKRIKGEAYTYFPSDFQVRIQTGLWGGIPIWDALKLSKSYYAGYATYFKETYQFPYVNLTQLVKDYQNVDYDYPEIAQVYDNQFNILKSYLSVLNSEDAVFQTKAGYTFKDLIASLNVVQDLNLGSINALVNSSLLTKDRAQLILKYQYMLKRYALEQVKDNSDYVVSNQLLALLKEKESTMVLPDISGAPVTVTALDDSYDSLAKKANESQVRVGKRISDVVYIQRQIDRMNGQIIEKATLDATKKQADLLIVQLNSKIEIWIKTIEEASNEYFEYKYGKAISLHSTAAISGLSIKKIGALVLLLWIVAYGIVYGWQYLFNTGEKNMQHRKKTTIAAYNADVSKPIEP